MRLVWIARPRPRTALTAALVLLAACGGDVPLAAPVAPPQPQPSAPAVATAQAAVEQQLARQDTGEPMDGTVEASRVGLLDVTSMSGGSLKTRFGTVTLQEGPALNDVDMPSPTLTVDGKTVYEGGEDGLRVVDMRSVGDRDILLLADFCIGTGCYVDNHSVLVLSASAPPQMLTGDDTGGVTDTTNLVVRGQEVTVDLGWDNKQHKVAHLTADGLKVAWLPSTERTMPHATCEAAWQSLTNECILSGDDARNCLQPNALAKEFWFSGMLERGLVMMDRHPAFQLQGFYQLCHRACVSGEEPSFETFAAQVCTSPSR